MTRPRRPLWPAEEDARSWSPHALAEEVTARDEASVRAQDEVRRFTGDRYGLVRAVPGSTALEQIRLPSLGVRGYEFLGRVDPDEHARVTAIVRRRALHQGGPDRSSYPVILIGAKLPEEDWPGGLRTEQAALERCGLTLAAAQRLLERTQTGRR